jgi:hypothetical protein
MAIITGPNIRGLFLQELENRAKDPTLKKLNPKLSTEALELVKELKKSLTPAKDRPVRSARGRARQAGT